MNKENKWSSKIGFILSAAGAAIGLGAIWKFPYVAGMNGGGAFLIVFIVFTVLIGLPMLISEFIIGRGAGREAVSAYDYLAPKSGWRVIGRIGVLSCFLLLSFYSVVGGWVLIYTILSILGLVIQDGQQYGEMFGMITSSPWITPMGTLAFILINILIVALGVKKGIERASKYMMPILFILLLLLVIRAVTLDGAMEGVSFILKPDFSALTAEGILYALGQSFFALAVGFSCMVTYASYLDKKVSIPSSAGMVVLMNIIVSVFAGLVIFPVVFAFGFEPSAGPELLFIVLPAVFEQMGFGSVFLAVFLVLFLFATLTSSISLLEIVVASFVAKGKSRSKIAWYAGIIVFIVGIPAGLSSGLLSDVIFFDRNIFDLTDYLVSNIMLPLGSLLISLFIGIKMKKKLLQTQFEMSSPYRSGWFKTWYFLMRYVVPITIVIVFLNMLGIIG